ncbi:MAG TPA: quinone-dependent dihydroorotate dehydrogenase [Bacteroidia bacterium]|jgi:dihydroorotate dehydrogenase|nr:quinone-dependent dihydroorotate dehydrogenase [Bacteroidia bacterium]HQF28075.1 quinone-dependent dihydroorotate dehydrogenase [Bacteroidia bacterium]HQK97512.1 quinone-dependent dihydroorotate dehydrogenase [Bacteroidia bacterium]
MYKRLIRPFLFLFDPETAHHLVFNLLKVIFKIPGVAVLVKGIYGYKGRDLSKMVMGITFPNPIGLAAGFDKNAMLFEELSCLGFGFIEIGTLTPKAQPGNDLPRMFRLPADKGLINRMGFNNEGVEKAVERLKKQSGKVIIGGNIGKNKITPNEVALRDYDICFEALFPYVDYFVVNVSSPNTPGLRELQDKEPLTALLKHVMKLNSANEKPKPVLLKIAPDLTNEQLTEIVEIVKEVKLTGIIATNTTISRQGLTTATEVVKEQGGLSGLPVKSRSTEVIRYLRQLAGKDLVIIGVGGIFTSEDAKEKLDAGADLLQVYTGFIYEGPGMIKSILKGL